MALETAPSTSAPLDQSPAALVEFLTAVGERKDADAFSSLFGFFAPRIKSFYLRSGANDALAEEMMQETLLLVWRKASLFNPAIAGASTWIYTIARNHRIDRFRREQRFTQLEDHVADNEQAEDAKAEDAVFATQSEALLHDAIRQLPSEQIEVLHLSFFENHTHSEIAQRLKLPMGTVKSRLRLAFGKLRNNLEGMLE